MNLNRRNNPRGFPSRGLFNAASRGLSKRLGCRGRRVDMATSWVLNENNVPIWVVRTQRLEETPGYGLTFFFRKHGLPTGHDRSGRGDWRPQGLVCKLNLRV
jgi:hypothetical protein